jgi:epoxyqueuosine reductase QueG
MKKEEDNYNKLKRFTAGQGFSLFGVADITKARKKFNLEEKTTAQFKRALSLGKKLLDAVLDDIKDKPTPLYFHHYRQINFFLDRQALLTASYLQELGYKALPIAASQIIDWEKQSSHVSHKEIGYLAGLGWIGRNNLLVHPSLGARFRLVTILTDLPLTADKPLDRDCGECRACIDICPAQAIKEKQEDFNHIGCFEQLKEWRRRHVVSQYICGVCVKACSSSSSQFDKFLLK